jgi:hypothetical protein
MDEIATEIPRFQAWRPLNPLYMYRNLLLFALYFLLSTVLTWLFVVVSPLYISNEQLVLSTAVAGGKWAVQIGLGWFFLKEKAPLFLRNIGFVCLVGSIALVPYILCGSLDVAEGPQFFVGSLVASVAAMIYLYYKAIRNTGISIYWWICWLLCLAIAITLQLTVVFDVV